MGQQSLLEEFDDPKIFENLKVIPNGSTDLEDPKIFDDPKYSSLNRRLLRGVRWDSSRYWKITKQGTPGELQSKRVEQAGKSRLFFPLIKLAPLKATGDFSAN